MSSNPDRQWKVGFDGSSDRGKQPVATTVFATVKPLVIAADSFL